MGALVLLMVLGWGLLWSAATSNALLAAVLAITSALLIIPAADNAWNLRLFNQENANPAESGDRGLSHCWARPSCSSDRGPHVGPAGKTRVSDRAATQAEAAAASIGTVRPGRPWFWPAAMRSLAWQTGRDLRSIGGWVILLAVAIPLFGYLRLRPLQEPVAGVLHAGRADSCGYQRVRDRAIARERRLSSRIMEWRLTWSGWSRSGRGWPPSRSWRFWSRLVHLATGFLLPRGARKEFQALLADVWLPCDWVRGCRAVRDDHPPRDHGGPGGAGLLDRAGLPLGLDVGAGTDAVWILVAASSGSARGRASPGAPTGCSTGPEPGDGSGSDSFSPARSRLLFVGYVSYRVASVPTLDPERDAELFTFSTPITVPESENAAGLYRKAVSVAGTKRTCSS